MHMKIDILKKKSHVRYVHRETNYLASPQALACYQWNSILVYLFN